MQRAPGCLARLKKFHAQTEAERLDDSEAERQKDPFTTWKTPAQAEIQPVYSEHFCLASQPPVDPGSIH